MELTERSPDGPALWRSAPLWVAAAIAAVEALSWGAGLWWQVGDVPLSPSAALGLVVVAVYARRGRLGAPAVPIVAFLAVAVLCAAVYSGTGTPVALVAAAAGEESVYRLALPLLVAALLRRAGAPRPVPCLAAVASVSVLFAFLPGHVAQFATSPLGPVPWIGLSVMWMWMLWRGASIVVVAAHHTALNCVAFSTSAGASPLLWTAAVVVPALTWMVLEGRRDRRLGLHGLLIDDAALSAAR